MKLTAIAKSKTTELKGVAIFMMLFLHLFNQAKNVDLCTTAGITVGGEPLVLFLSHGMGPVSIYLFLSGYGLYYNYRNQNRGGNFRRIIRLYIVYWTSILLFGGLGCLLRPDIYPSTLADIVGNLTGWKTNYNFEAWFLFPYVLLALSSQWVFRLLDRYGIAVSAGLSGLAFLASGYLISRYNTDFFYLPENRWIYHIALYANTLFAFLLGGIFCKLSGRDFGEGRFSLFITSGYFVWPLILLLFAVRCFVNSQAFSPVFVVLFVPLFVHAPLGRGLEKFLSLLGKYSTGMWLVHSYFCYYLFHDFIYGFRYPALILVVLLLLSFSAAYVVQRISAFLTAKIGL